MNQIKLESGEPAVSKKKEVYWKYKTSEGDMSCFEQSVYEQLNKCFGKLVNVDVAKRNDYKNITAFHGSVEETVEGVKSPPSNPSTAQTPPLEHQMTLPNEPAYRAKISQGANGKCRWEVTVRANTLDEIKQRLFDMTVEAQKECDRLNFGEEKPKGVEA